MRGGLSDWGAALQVPMFVAILSPVLVGAAVAVREGHTLDTWTLLLTFAALALIQAATNLQKGYFEAKDLPVGVARPAASLFAFDVRAVGRLGPDPRRIYRLSLGPFAAAALLGLYLDSVSHGHVVLALGLAGAALGYSYSGPPLRMSYRGLGEVNTFLAFGPLAVVGVHYVQAHTLSSLALLASLPLGCFTAAISVVRYFLTVEEDRVRGKGDPVVRFGRRAGLALLGSLLLGGSVLVLALALAGVLPVTTMVMLPLVLPQAPLILMGVRSGEPSQVLMAVKLVVLVNLLGGLGLAAGFLL